MKIYKRIFLPIDAQLTYLQLEHGKENVIVQYKLGDQLYIQSREQTFGPYDSIKKIQSSNGGRSIVINFNRNKKHFIQVNNHVFGPYQKYNKVNVKKASHEFAFSFTDKFDNNYFRINELIYGPFKNIQDQSTSENYFAFSYSLLNSDKTFLRLNQHRLGPFRKLIQVDFSANSNIHQILVEKNKKFFLLQSPYNTLRNPYQKILNNKVTLSKGKALAFNYMQDDFIFAHLQANNKTTILGPDKTPYYFYFYNDGNRVGAYQKIIDAKLNKVVVKLKSNDFGPYTSIKHLIASNDGLSHLFAYTKKGSEGIFITDQSKHYGPFEKIDMKFLRHSQTHSYFSFGYVKNKKFYLQVKEKTYGPYSKPPEKILVSKELRDAFYSIDIAGKKEIFWNGTQIAKLSAFDFALKDNTFILSYPDDKSIVIAKSPLFKQAGETSRF